MSTFTKRIADSSDRLPISGPILLNWYFVMIEKSNNSGRIIIENPQVLKVKMQGKENFQISGDTQVD